MNPAPRPTMRIGATAHRLPLLLLVAGVAVGALSLALVSRPAAAEPQTYTVVRHILYRDAAGSLVIEEAESRTIEQFQVNAHIWGTNSLPVTVQFNAEGAPAGHDAVALIQNALTTWNGVTGSFQFVNGGASSADTGSCANGVPQVDGVNTIAFNDGIGSLSLGETCTIYPNTGPNTKLVEFDMRLNPDDIWFSGASPVAGKFDLATTILHELGHAAGIGHSNNTEAVMYYQLDTATIRRALHADDIAGLTAAYPNTTTTTPTPTATPTQTPTASPTPPPITTVPPPQGAFKVRTLQLARD